MSHIKLFSESLRLQFPVIKDDLIGPRPINCVLMISGSYTPGLMTFDKC